MPHALLYNSGLVSQSTLNLAGFFIVLFNLTYLFFKIGLNKKIHLNFYDSLIDSRKILRNNESTNWLMSIYIISFGMIIFGFISNGLSLLNFTWAESHLVNRSIYERFASFILISTSGLGAVFYLRKEKIKLVIVTFFFIVYIFLTRSRYNIIPFAIPFLFIFLYSGNLKRVIKALFIGMGILFLVFFLQQVRYAGTIYDLFKNYSIKDIIDNTIQFMSDGKGEFGLSRVFYYFLENDNNFNNFEEAKTYIRLLFLPFPSSILPIKPRDFAMDMWEAWHGSKTYIGTMHPTLYGDVYANFGFKGFLFGGIYGLFSTINDWVLLKQKSEIVKILYISIIGTMYVLLARGAVYNSIANAFWSLIILNIFLLIMRVSKKVKL